MNAKSILFTLGIGGLIGVFVPLPKSEGTRPARSSSTGFRSRAPDLIEVREIPKNATYETARTFAASKPNGFFRWMLEADPQPSPDEVQGFFREWIKQDPDSAFEAALRLPARFGYQSGFFMEELWRLSYWDPACALRWTSRIEGVLGRPSSLSTNLQHLFTRTNYTPDPEEVRALFNGGPIGPQSAELAIAYARLFADRDPATAMRWAASLNVEYQNAVFPTLIARLAQTNPAMALHTIKNAPSHLKQYAALSALGRDSPIPAIEGIKWLEEEMGVTRYSGNGGLMNKFYKEDPQAAEDYVMSLGDTIQRTEAARGMAAAVVSTTESDKTIAAIFEFPVEVRMDAIDAVLTMQVPDTFPALIESLNDDFIGAQNLDAYSQKLAAFLKNERNVKEVLDDSVYLSRIQNWLRDNPGSGRDRFIAEAAEVLKDQPKLRNQLFKKIPSKELLRIWRKP